MEKSYKPVGDYKEVGKFLEENIDYIYFNCEYSCTFGESYTERVRGKTIKFIMWRDIIITENLMLEINSGGHKGIEIDVINQIFELLETEFNHALGTNTFDQVKDSYKIKGIKLP